MKDSKKEKKFDCKDCDMKFTTKSNLNRHTKNMHREKEDNIVKLTDNESIFRE